MVANAKPVTSLNALTGLRWFAALIVFAHHAWAHFGLEVRGRFFDLGHLACLAVSFFFVLSGFILTYVYHQRMESRDQARLFWFTRWARIWPLHAVCLLIFIALFIDHFNMCHPYKLTRVWDWVEFIQIMEDNG